MKHGYLDKNELVSAIKNVFCKVTGRDSLPGSVRISDSDLQSLDSLDKVRFVLELEQYFAVELDLGELMLGRSSTFDHLSEICAKAKRRDG